MRLKFTPKLMTEHPLKILAGSSHPELAHDIARELSVEVEPIKLGRFADNSIDVTLTRSVRGCDTFVIQTCTDRPNEDLMELFIIMDALRHSFAEKIHAVIPHLGYARADSMSEHESRKPLSARLVAQLLNTAGASHAMMFNLHARQIQGFFPWPVDNLYATNLLVNDILAKEIPDLVLVAPDSGAAKATEYVARKMGVPMAIVNKMRPSANVSEVTSVVGEVDGKTCVIFDDMIDTAGTVVNAKKALLDRGANPDVYLYATHPVLSPPATERLTMAGFREVVVTNTIPIPEEKRFPGLRQASVAPILAKVISSVHASARSVSECLKTVCGDCGGKGA